MEIRINNNIIADNCPAYIIAELSANHNQNFEIAEKTIRAMKDAGADAVKTQTYTPDSMTLNIDNEMFMTRKESIWAGQKLYDLYSKAAMPYDWHEKIKRLANDLQLDFFSTPFDFEGVDLLSELDVPAYKIASFEITDLPLIERTASKGKPIIISTGIATLSDIELAVNSCKKVGNNEIILLKCTSEYPASIERANLVTIPHLRQTFDIIPGISDHTMGATVPIVAVTLGAKVIEKHFILSRDLGGPDAIFSMEPQEFSAMVTAVRDAEAAVGKIDYEVSDKNKLRRRSLFAIKDIKAGEPFCELNVASKRPGYGLHPSYYESILGKKARTNISIGTPLTLGMVLF
jgi:pseudaminic acid synthase